MKDKSIPAPVSGLIFIILACLITPTVTSAQAPTAKASASGFLSSAEQAVLDEINLARAQPQAYAAFVEATRKFYNGKSYQPPGQSRAIQTFEGTSAVDEAVNFLRAAKPLPPLDVARGMSLAARDHVKDLSTNGISGHRGSDGSTPNDRVDRYGEWQSAIGEAIVYKWTTARDAVIGMIVDDGVPSRGHRNSIFDAKYSIAGIAVGAPSAFGTMAVITYAGGFKEKPGSGSTDLAGKGAAQPVVAPSTNTTRKTPTRQGVPPKNSAPGPPAEKKRPRE